MRFYSIHACYGKLFHKQQTIRKKGISIWKTSKKTGKEKQKEMRVMMSHNSVLIDLYKNNHFKPSTIIDSIINIIFFSVLQIAFLFSCLLSCCGVSWESNNYSLFFFIILLANNEQKCLCVCICEVRSFKFHIKTCRKFSRLAFSIMFLVIFIFFQCLNKTLRQKRKKNQKLFLFCFCVFPQRLFRQIFKAYTL